MFDNLAGKLHVIVLADTAVEDAWEQANGRLDELLAQLSAPFTPRPV